MRTDGYADAMTILMSPRKLQEALEKSIESSRNLCAAVTNTTAKLTGMPSGGNSDRDGLCVNYIASKESVITAREELVKARREVSKLLNDAGLNDRQYAIMCRYYLWFKTWNDIATELGVSDRTVYRDLEEAMLRCDLAVINYNARCKND